MAENEKTKPLQVLIAEDDPDDQFIFETALREIDPKATVHFFYTSHALVDHLVKAGIQNDALTAPDLIIGDMKPPFFELKDIAEIRTFKQFESIPVYVFTEWFTDITRTNALTLGANGFYHKPNSLHTLKNMLSEIILKKRAPEQNEPLEIKQDENITCADQTNEE